MRDLIIPSRTLVGCWHWTGRINPDQGRPVIKIEGVDLFAARVMWEISRAPIPATYEIDHLCGNRACVNPNHLEPVTPEENRRRAKESAPIKAARYGERIAQLIRETWS